MPTNERLIKQIRYEILEKCQEGLVAEYRETVWKAKATVPNFLKLVHPPAFLHECRGIELMNTLYFDNEQHKSENMDCTVKYWAASMDILMNYIWNTPTKNSNTLCMTSLLLTWETFVINIALLHLGPIAKPQLIWSENVKEAFQSIHQNYAMVKNRNWSAPKIPQLEKKVWKYAWGNRRKVHRWLMIRRLEKLFQNLRTCFGWPKTRRLIYRNSEIVPNCKAFPPPPGLQKQWLPHVERVVSRSQRDRPAMQVKDITEKSPSDLLAAVQCAWPSYVKVGADVRHKQFPSQIYSVEALERKKLMLKLRPGVDSSLASVIPLSIEVKSASEIMDLAELGSSEVRYIESCQLQSEHEASAFLQGSPNLHHYRPHNKRSDKKQVTGKRARPFEESEPENAKSRSSQSHCTNSLKLSCMSKTKRQKSAMVDFTKPLSPLPRENPIFFSKWSGRGVLVPKKPSAKPPSTSDVSNPRRSARLSAKKAREEKDKIEKDRNDLCSSEEKEVETKVRTKHSNSLAMPNIKASIWDPAKLPKPSHQPKPVSTTSTKPANCMVPQSKQSRTFSTNSKRQRQRKSVIRGKRVGSWSISEQRALWNGLIYFPPQKKSSLNRGRKGCWSNIKMDRRWRKALAGRTTTQMKDKARSWISSGELVRVAKKRKNVRRK